MIKGDVVEVMIALPGQLFLNTQIPVCLWFLTNDKTANGRDRRNETLFIDARNLGTMETRVLKVLTDEDIQKIQDTVSSWRDGDDYEDIKGFCKSASIEDIEAQKYILYPARYVGFREEEREDEFVKRFEELISSLEKNQKKSNSLNEKILSSLKKLNHD